MTITFNCKHKLAKQVWPFSNSTKVIQPIEYIFKNKIEGKKPSMNVFLIITLNTNVFVQILSLDKEMYREGQTT